MIPGFALVALLGYWLASTASQPAGVEVEKTTAKEAPKRVGITEESMPKFRRAERPPSSGVDLDALNAGAFAGQRVIAFKDQSALDDFLKRAGNRIQLLGRLDALNALRVGFSDYDDLASLLGLDDEESFIFPVNAPSPGEGSVQPGAMELGNGLHEWLGITGDNSDWGKGVKIAVLDTGVDAHPAFETSIRSINIVDRSPGGSANNGHGTAVASVIIGIL